MKIHSYMMVLIKWHLKFYGTIRASGLISDINT